MKTIELTRGKQAIVDDDAYEYLNKWKWNCDGEYAVRSVRVNTKHHKIFMHKQVIGVAGDVMIDHVNCNSLDNRMENLRFTDSITNGRNRRKIIKGTSQYKGVSLHKPSGRWYAYLSKRVDGKKKVAYLGYFEHEIDAAKAYDKAAIEHFGEFARPNFEALGKDGGGK